MVQLQRIFIVFIFDFFSTYHYFYSNTVKQILTRYYKDFQWMSSVRTRVHRLEGQPLLNGLFLDRKYSTANSV